MPRITKPKKNNSQAKTKRSQRSTRGNAAATKPPPTVPFTMTTRRKARDEAEAQKAQVLAADRKSEALCRDWMNARARNLLFEEMKFEELGLRTRLGGRSRERLQEDRRATRTHNLRLRELLVDMSATLGSPKKEPKTSRSKRVREISPPEQVAEIPLSEPEPEISPPTKGASTHAAITAARLSRFKGASLFVKTGAVTAGGVHRWEIVEA